VGESRVVSPPFNSGLCKRCGGTFQYAATLPKSVGNDGYDIYQCGNCKCIEWICSTSLTTNEQPLAKRVER
jgi:hypothetical protein